MVMELRQKCDQGPILLNLSGFRTNWKLFILAPPWGTSFTLYYQKLQLNKISFWMVGLYGPFCSLIWSPVWGTSVLVSNWSTSIVMSILRTFIETWNYRNHSYIMHHMCQKSCNKIPALLDNGQIECFYSDGLVFSW